MRNVLKNIAYKLRGNSHDIAHSRKTTAKSYSWGHFDSVEIEPCGLLRIKGFIKNEVPELTGLHVYVNAHEVTILNSYKTYRPDLAKAFSPQTPFCGFVLEYLLHPLPQPEISEIEINFNNEKVFKSNEKITLSIPHFDGLFSEKKILHRDNIYGYGPPGLDVGQEIQDLSKFLISPVIDFGCGSGALVKILRAEGLQAFGIEIKRQPVIDSLIKEAEPYITLYDGQIPLPYANNAFESGICVEVLEHVADYETVIAELARIIKRRLIITVPDISTIPLLHRHRVVPWHLLESTHLNFFTQSSLSDALKKYFSTVEFLRISPVVVNGTQFYTSLVAIAENE